MRRSRPVGTPTSPNPISPSATTTTAWRPQAHLSSLALALLTRSTSRRPHCLCPMLDARDDSTSVARGAYGEADVETNHWVEVVVEPVVTRAPRASIEGSPASSAAGSGRNSPSGLRSRKAALQSQSRHRRCATADDGALTVKATTATAHPLQPSSPRAMGLSRSAEEGVTRPALKRLLSDKGLWVEGTRPEVREGEAQEDMSGRPALGEGTMLMIVHEVSRTDSLAGVALKYGITLADLRKANQLWASDSIHLRKKLYVPLHLTDGKRFSLDPADTAVNENRLEGTSTYGSTSAIIERVPISQLQFFPPSSQPLQTTPYGTRLAQSLSSPDRSSSPSSSTQTLTSFLHALPLPSRQTFFARLSLDSSETSSAYGASETSSDQEHELDELGRRSLEGRTPTARKRSFASSPSPSPHKQAYLGRGAMKSKRDSESEATVLMSDFDVDLGEVVPLQTEQLKPSPRMELPNTQRNLRK